MSSAVKAAAARDDAPERHREVVDASVIICCFTEDRFDDTLNAVESVRSQSVGPREILLVVDHNRSLLERLDGYWPDVTVLANENARGLSGGRNTGVSHARGWAVAFLDDDAVAGPNWIEQFFVGLRELGATGWGSAVLPNWDGRPPRWLPPEFLWTVGCSWSGLPTSTSQVRNVIGASMAFRRSAIVDSGGFADGFSTRRGRIPGGCDETEMCIRLARDTDARILYDPSATVRHRVRRERTSLSYFTRRCIGEGIAKVSVMRLAAVRGSLDEERRHLTSVLPRAAARELLAAARGDVGGVARLAALLWGTIATVAGYGAARFRLVSGAAA